MDEKINTHSGSMITYDPVPENEWKVKHHDYYLEGKLEFLDSEGSGFLIMQIKCYTSGPHKAKIPIALTLEVRCRVMHLVCQF